MTVDQTGNEGPARPLAEAWTSEATMRCPYPFYEEVRATCPVFELDGQNTFILSRYGDVVEAARQPHAFSNHRKTLGEGDPEFEEIMRAGYPEVPTLTPNDPPEHTRYRKLINRSFTPRAVARLEDSIEEIVDGLIDRFIDAGRCDFVADFAGPLPSTVIGNALGVPGDRLTDCIRWANAIRDAVSLFISRERALEAKREYVEFQNFFAGLIQERMENLGDDMISEMITARYGDERPLTLPEMLDLIRVFIAGGNLTTIGMLTSGMLLLLKHPDQMRAIREDHELIRPFLEETLRIESPAQFLPRTVEEPGGYTLGDVHIPEGARVVVSWAAANRDPDVFHEPDSFDIRRPDLNEHIAFGFGTHFCVGSALARAEGRIAFERLLTRLDDIECEIAVDEVKYEPSLIDRAVEFLPIRFTRR
jgi:cytochrome P450